MGVVRKQQQPQCGFRDGPIPEASRLVSHDRRCAPSHDHGRVRPFDRAAYRRFDEWLAAFGEPTYVAAKRALFDDVRAGRLPREVAPAPTRLTRNARRIGVRQLAHLDGPSAILNAWRLAVEPGEPRPTMHAH